MLTVLLAGAVIAIWRVTAGRAPLAAPGSAAGSNVLLITIDTLRADRVGVYGNRSGLTPTLDRIAEGGLRFENAFTPVPLTLPAHASILTGLQPFGHGIRNNTAFKLGPTPTLGSMLKTAGYRTGAFVGAFVLSADFGLNRDFDVYDDRVGPTATTPDFHTAERRAERVLQAAADWILGTGSPDASVSSVGDRQARPWFAWVHLYDPHAPYEAPPDYRPGRSPYDAEVAYTDAMIGRCLDGLRANGQLERTLLVLVADHGEALGDHGEGSHGLFAYDSTLRVPLILSRPGIRAGVVTAPVTHVDLVPTVLDLLGIPAPRDLDGRSLLVPDGTGRTGSRALYFEALDANLTRGWAPLVGVIVDRWKYIDLPIPELYDLQGDPTESHNLASTDRERVRVLQARLADVAGRRGVMPEASPAATDADTRERLASLGYVGSVENATRHAFTEDDDPKKLVAINETFYEAFNEARDGQSGPALAKFLDVLAKRPDFLAARLSAATILSGEGREAEAIALLESAPNAAVSASTQAQLGRTLEASGRLPEAAAHLEAAARLRGEDTETLNSLAVVYARLGRFEDGRRLFRRILDVKTDAAAVWNNLGTLETSAGNRGAAADAFRQAVAADPDYGAAWRGLGNALAAIDPAGAVEAWQRAVALEPRDYDSLFNLGLVLSAGPAPEDALRYLETFVAQAPADRYGRDITRATTLISQVERRRAPAVKRELRD